MKLLWLIAIFALSVSANAPFDKDETRIHGENGWYIPQIDGSFEWMDMAEAESTLEELERMDEETNYLSLTPVTFYLYTKSNPQKGQKITQTTKSIAASHFNANNPTRFVIHGWTQSVISSMNRDIRNAWLSHDQDYNVIYVDWARARSVEYVSSVAAVPKTGKQVASMIDYLAKIHGMSLDTLQVAGHSLGAHVAGYAGKNTKSGQIHTIVGLDPALPLFSYKKTKKRLASTDAFYVESIQTDGGQLGFLKPIGKGAFYPNGGKSQPGCTLDVTGACAHGRSVTYYAEAVERNDFPTVKCSDYEQAVAKSCGSTYSSVRMGATINAYMVAGDYYVPVNSKAPFGVAN